MVIIRTLSNALTYNLEYNKLYQIWVIMPQKIINPKMVNADIVIKEQTKRSKSVRHLITNSILFMQCLKREIFI